jgi:regulator of replication initiation timing
MIDDLVKEIDGLKKEINLLKQSTKFVMDKLEKTIGDRIELRAENYKLKESLKKEQAVA